MYEGDEILRTAVIKAVRGTKELDMALYKPAPNSV